MDERLLRVIREWQELELPQVKERDTEVPAGSDLVLDIVGPRRSGKTSLMFLMAKSSGPRGATLYINFENRKLLPLKEDLLNDVMEHIHGERLLEKHDCVYLFLDEVQQLPGWERYVRSIYDENRGKIRIRVSGSSSSLLSKEYAGLLTGRHLTVRVLPLSFSEFLRFRQIPVPAPEGVLGEAEEARIRTALNDYLENGGFPEVALGREGGPFLAQLMTDVISRDIISRGGVRNVALMEELAAFLIENVGALLSFGKMARYLQSRGVKATVPTLLNYFERMKEAFLFFDGTIDSPAVRDRMQFPRKIYCIDNGLLTASGVTSPGKLCENVVAVELLRRGLPVRYWKSRDGREVDFVVKDRSGTVPVQVCADAQDPVTRDRELRSLAMCAKELGLKEGVLITLGTAGEEKYRGMKIRHVPLWKFLLGTPVRKGRSRSLRLAR